MTKPQRLAVFGVCLASALLGACGKDAPPAKGATFTCRRTPEPQLVARNCSAKPGADLECARVGCFTQDRAHCFSALMHGTPNAAGFHEWMCAATVTECQAWRDDVVAKAKRADDPGPFGPCIEMKPEEVSQ